MKKIVLVILLVILAGCSKNEIDIDTYNNKDVTPYYGILLVPSIDMNLGFYEIGHKNNTVSKNVAMIESNIKNTYILAAHSGSGKLSYFNNLRYLSKGDDIYIKFRDKLNHYIISDIKKEVKNGSIHIPNKEDMLILTTCDQIKKGYQLIIIAYLDKEK